MTDTTPPPIVDTPTLEGITPDRIRKAFTARELGEWELTLGLQLDQFTGTYVTAMLAWWAARQDGEKLTPDEVLDLSLDALMPYMARAVELLGKPQTGGETPAETPSTPSETASSASSPSSDSSTTSPSPSFSTIPGPS